MHVLSGTFWHITDLHWDPTYKLNDNPELVCASSGKRPADNPGEFGDYVCDSPWSLINSSVYTMKDILPDPDFIIWTGYASDCFLFHLNVTWAACSSEAYNCGFPWQKSWCRGFGFCFFVPSQWWYPTRAQWGSRRRSSAIYYQQSYTHYPSSVSM